jgi:hypothetical protein
MSKEEIETSYKLDIINMKVRQMISNIDELTLMLDVINSSIVTGLGMPANNSPCHKKILELMERNGRKPTAGQ